MRNEEWKMKNEKCSRWKRMKNPFFIFDLSFHKDKACFPFLALK